MTLMPLHISLQPAPSINFVRVLKGFLCAMTVCFTGLLSYSVLPSTAVAQTLTERPKTEIATIKFNLGRLEQDLKAYGQWTEYDFRGQERYKFTEIESNPNTLRLLGQNGSVQLLIDLENKIISGEWAGHPMEKLYTIVEIDRMMFTASPTVKARGEITASTDVPAIRSSDPLQPSTEPSVEPFVQPEDKTFTEFPSNDTPTLTPPLTSLPVPLILNPNTRSGIPLLAGPSSTVSGTDFGQAIEPALITLVAHSDGAFIKKRGFDWIETTPNTVFDLKKIGHSETSIFLYEQSRGRLVALDLKNRFARSSQGGRLEILYPLTSIDQDSMRILAPQNPIVDGPDTSESSQAVSILPSPPQTIPQQAIPEPIIPELVNPEQPDSEQAIKDGIKTEIDTKPVSDRPVVQTPEFNQGRLTIKERFECRKKGGFVERAGRLGAERCTIRYSDGGNVCLDSQDCQGKCQTKANSSKKTVSGKCQMTDNPFGCRAEVVNGEAEPMICVD